MILGIAANNSIAVPSGLFNQSGESSVKKIAIPKLIGTAISIAIKDVTKVPTIGTNAPNSSVTGFHRSEKMKSKPNLSMEGREP